MNNNSIKNVKVIKPYVDLRLNKNFGYTHIPNNFDVSNNKETERLFNIPKKVINNIFILKKIINII